MTNISKDVQVDPNLDKKSISNSLYVSTCAKYNNFKLRRNSQTTRIPQVAHQTNIIFLLFYGNFIWGKTKRGIVKYIKFIMPNSIKQELKSKTKFCSLYINPWWPKLEIEFHNHFFDTDSKFEV